LIDVNVQKMSSLIAELLDVARLQGGEVIELQLAETDLVAIARKVAAGFDLTGGKNRVLVETDEPVVVGLWDACRLERVLTNLVSNGLKYSPGSGDVTIHVGRELRRARHVAVVTVTDHGRGIPAADLPHVFEWFHRGSNVSDLAGTGVGMASAKLIVERHGGDIYVKSRPGRGTKVTLRLPARTPLPAQPLVSQQVTLPAAEPQPAGRE